MKLAIHALKFGIVLLALLVSFRGNVSADAPDFFFKVTSGSGPFVGAWYVAPNFWDEAYNVSCPQCS